MEARDPLLAAQAELEAAVREERFEVRSIYHLQND